MSNVVSIKPALAAMRKKAFERRADKAIDDFILNRNKLKPGALLRRLK